MNTLLVDIGNTRVKWALLRGTKLGRMHAALHDGKPAALRALVRAASSVDDVVAVCVAGARLERALSAAVKQRFGFTPRFIRSTRQAVGVRSGYRETWRLGADRWVGAIGAFAFARGAVVVANIGTALTIDAVTAAGKHLGGAIVPGPSTMIESLLSGTHGIRRRARGGMASTRSLYAADTASALGAGATHAAAAFIDRAVAEAAEKMGARPVLVLTGGAAPALKAYIKSRAQVVPDLVLRGLAVLARD
ncbi:MAG TPA: type III pantothenate kinase [Steroidobacteraceae bacterium]|nr:type III pantothenate kinase [Steroidobacteraceae bacterium]